MSWNTLNTTQQTWFSGVCTTSYATTYAITPPTSRYICDCWNATWSSVIPQNFDNVGNAMLTLFEISTTEGWVDVMYAAVDATGIDMQPIRDYSAAWVWFFVAFMVVGSFFVMNLFVGVIIDNFNRMKSSLGDEGLMTEEQLLWVKTQKEALKVKPLRVTIRPTASTRGLCFDLMSFHYFDTVIMGCIISNTLLMATQSFGMSSEFENINDYLNTTLAVIFTLEAVIKIMGLGKAYFYDSWNRFDFSIVVGTSLGYILEAITGTSLSSVAMIVRTFRICRMVRLIKGAKGLKQILLTLYLSLPGLTNITSLLFLMLFIFSVMGVQIYAKVALNGSLTVHANFQGFFTAILFLWRATTGENWNGAMHSLATSLPGCVVDPEYQDDMCGFNDIEGCIPLNGCGNPSIYLFMLAFTILVTYVMLNLSIAVILEGFAQSEEVEDTSSSSTTLDPDRLISFKQAWAHFDPKATSYITISEMPLLLQLLSPPMGVLGMKNMTEKKILRIVSRMKLPLYDTNLVHFKDVMKEMAKNLLQYKNPFLNSKMMEIAELPIRKPKRRQSVYQADYYIACITVQRAVRVWSAFRIEVRHAKEEQKREEKEKKKHRK